MNRPPPPPTTPSNSAPSTPPLPALSDGSRTDRRARRLWLNAPTNSDGFGMQSEEFDALTDLFLGEVTRPHRHELVESTGTTAPRLRLTPDEPEEDTETPTAVEAKPASAVMVGAAAAPFVECLMVGNLPVLASAWASQYLREIAEASGGPIAAVRLQAGFMTIELVGEVPEAVRATQPGANPEHALRDAAAITRRWVVRVDPADEGHLAERGLVKLVTLLTGADEPARVGAYGSLKQLAEKVPAILKNGRPSPIIRVAIMSASDAAATVAANRLVETVRQCLGRDVQHAICSAKIKATRPSTTLFGGKTDLSASLLMDMLQRVLGIEGDAAATIWDTKPTVVETTATAALDSMDAPNIDGRSASRVMSVEQIIEDLSTEPRQIEPTDVAEATAEVRGEATGEHPVESPVEMRAAFAEVAIAPIAVKVDQSTPAPVSRVDDVRLWATGAATADRGAKPAPTLSTHGAGLQVLNMHCPYAPGVELATDSHGGLHALAMCEGANLKSTALDGLVTARAWLESHRMLLAAALSRPLADRRPELHLFTANPRETRGLLDTDIHIHLLARVTIEGREGWYSTELN